jgi:hypothetical protein
MVEQGYFDPFPGAERTINRKGASVGASQTVAAAIYVSCFISRRKTPAQVWRVRYQLISGTGPTIDIIADAQTVLKDGM